MAENVLERNIRILVAKPGLDGHDRGAIVLCQAFKDAGMEVIYTGLYQTPEMIVNAAITEDVDVIALSNLDGTYIDSFQEVVRLLKEKNAGDICTVGGGAIMEEDKSLLEAKGVTGNYGPGTPLEVIIDHVIEKIKGKNR
jgi:methylmalonyl-CoA mutase C-terminal domain/subunit